MLRRARSAPPAQMICCAALAAAALLAGATGVARAGDGDQVAKPTTTSPPGPWDGTFSSAVGYRPAASTRCATAPVADRGPGTVLGLFVVGVPCSDGERLVRAYQRCLDGAAGRAGACFGRTYRRCVEPVLLGGCRATQTLLPRTVGRYRCVERRLYRVGARWEGQIACRDGARRVSHAYTLFSGGPVAVRTEAQLRAAWANPRTTAIDVTRDIFLRACRTGDPIRESGQAITLDGHGHTLRQVCFEKRLLRQDGTGFVRLKDVTLTRGGTDGPGAAITTRGEIEVVDSTITQNLSEEPGGGVFSMRRATIIRSVVTGNLANDDGGGVYARRGGIRVYDSVVSSNLVDGSGGALASTGDILVVRSHVDGNTTDGDGGAIYADEDGDVVVIDSTVDGSTADGPGGAIFTLDGDVTVVRSTLNGNRADDRGGAISGEADVTVIGSTIARNAANAHVGGGIWARGNLLLAASTVSNNYAEGQGGGVLAAGTVRLVNATVVQNIAPLAANVGAGTRLEAFGTIIGPALVPVTGGEAQPTGVNCRVTGPRSLGYNVVSDGSCGLTDASDATGVDPLLGPLRDNGGLGRTFLPVDGSPAVDRIPPAACRLPAYVEALGAARQLDGLVADRAALAGADQRGVARPRGAGCDAGAVEAP